MCQAYKDYKSAILNALSSGKNLYVTTIGEATGVYNLRRKIPDDKIFNYYSREGYYDISKIRVIRDEDNNLYGMELLKYLDENNLICGKQINDLPMPIQESLDYDFGGERTEIQANLMGLGISNFLTKGYHSSYVYPDDEGFFCVDEVDDDGIVVLPPTCSALILTDILLANKVKKIITFISSSDISPAMYVAHGLVVEISKSSIITVDCTNVEYEVYNSIINFSIRRYDASGYSLSSNLKYNNDYAFHFKCLRMCETCKSKNSNVYLNINEKDIPIEVNLKSEDRSVVLSVTEPKVNLSLNCDKELKLLVFRNVTDSFSGNIYLNNVAVCSFDLDNLKIDCFTKLISNIGTDTTFIMMPTKCKITEFQDLDRWISTFERLRQNGYLIKYNTTDSDIRYGDGVVPIHNLLYVEELYYALTINALNTVYGNTILSTSVLDRLTYQDKIYSYLDRLYGISKSTCGDLHFIDIYDRCCNTNSINITEYNVNEGAMVVEVGAGVRISLNLLQFYILRIFGMVCGNIVNLYSKNNIYCSSYVVNSGRNSLSGYELLFLSSATGVHIKYNNDFCDFYGLVFTTVRHPILRYYSESGAMGYKFSYAAVKTRTSSKYTAYNINKDVNWAEGIKCKLYCSVSETTIKYLDEVESLIKINKVKQKKEFEMLGIVKHSKTAGLYDGLHVTCISQKSITNNKVSTDLIMDTVYYSGSYTVYVVEDDAGNKYKIESRTLYKLLKNGDVTSDNLNYTLIDSQVVYIRDEYDKQVTEMVEQLKDNQLLLTDSSLSHPCNKLEFESISDGHYKLICYNIGEELLLPSFVYCVHEMLDLEKYIEDNYGNFVKLKKIGLEVGNSEPVDVTDRIFSLLSGTDGSYSVARRPGIEFYCSENAYVKGSKVLKITSVIANKLLELPQNLSIDFNYAYMIEGYDYEEVAPETKIVVRKGSTIYAIKSATEVEVAEDCLIHPRAFEGSRLKKLVLKGGKLPEYACKECVHLTDVVVDGGHVDINLLAFEGVANIDKITCINGGTYSFIGSDNALVINTLKLRGQKRELSNLYKDVIKEYDNKSSFEDTYIDAIPYGINSDFTIKLKQKDGKEVNLSIPRICELLDNNCINFKHTAKSGTEYDFIETLQYSNLRCLVFMPGINNDFCNSKVLVLLDIDRVEHIISLKYCNIIFAYQYKDWTTGNVKSLPTKYLNMDYQPGFFFDSEQCLYNQGFHLNAVCCSFWQNCSYYTIKTWENLYNYYKKSVSYRPDEWDAYGHRTFSTFYLPASHEMNYNYKKMDISARKGYVILGNKYKYAKKMHSQSYAIAPAHKVVIIPGIGENCVMELEPLTYSNTYDWSCTLWGPCKTLEIKAPTVINKDACTTAYNYKGIQERLSPSHNNNTMEVYVYAPVKMRIGSVAFDKLNVIDTDLVVDCTNILNWNNWDNLTGGANTFIYLSGNSRLSVINLTEDVLKHLYQTSKYAYAMQLLMNANNYEELKDTQIAKDILNLSKSAFNGLYDKAISTKFKTDAKIEISAEPYKKDKYDTEVFFDEDETEDDSITEVEKACQIQQSLEEGIIPPLITLDYIDDNITEASNEVVTAFSDLGNTDETVNFDDLSAKSAEMLVSMCNVDVKGLQEKYDIQIEEENKRKQELLEIQHKEEEIQASKQQEGLLKALEEERQNNINSFVKEQQERDKKSKAKAKDEYYKAISEEAKAEGSLSDEVDTAPLTDNAKVLTESVDKPNTRTTMLSDIFALEDNDKLACSLKSGLANIENTVELKDRIVLEVGNELCKNGIVIGYEVLNKSTNDVKRLSVDTVKQLCKDLRYRVVGIKYNRFSNTLVR